MLMKLDLILQHPNIPKQVLFIWQKE